MVKANVDTIAAVATPVGIGGVAVIRVSGLRVKDVCQQILGKELTIRKATHLPFLDAASNPIDEGLAIYFEKPNSFTGEDVLELQGHGGPVITDMIMERLLQLGVRLARPGEFSERAFLNNKIDLLQAEAIADLIAASSKSAAQLAIKSLQGEFSDHIKALNEKLIQLRLYIEAAIDFTDEEIDFLSEGKILESIQNILNDLTVLQKGARQGSLLREGLTIAIIGAPNVGKSSLLNKLSGRDLAIVTDIPGTTRDVLREQILIDDIPLHICDTAGIRESDDLVEQEGIRRTWQTFDDADVILHLHDASAVNTNQYSIPQNKTVINIFNKIDKLDQLPFVTDTGVYLSAKTGAGLDLLKQAIKQKVNFENQNQGIFLARRRHLDALSRAQTHLQAALDNTALELMAEELRLSHLALCEITGEFTADDLLGKIFSSFCIGK